MSKQTAGRSYFIKNTVRLKKFKDPSLINVCVQFTFLYFMTHGEELQPPLGFFFTIFLVIALLTKCSAVHIWLHIYFLFTVNFRFVCGCSGSCCSYDRCCLAESSFEAQRTATTPF